MLPTQNFTEPVGVESGAAFERLDVIARSANLISPAAKAFKPTDIEPGRFPNLMLEP